MDIARIRELTENRGTPLFIYSRAELERRAQILLNLQLPFGFIPRYAVKANAYAPLVHLLDEAGLWFDASSSFEAQFLIQQGIDGRKISLSSQQPAHNLPGLLAEGVQYVATSLHQLDLFLAMAVPGQRVGLRVNPGMGDGGNNRLTTGGVNASFGLWHEYVPLALQKAQAKGVLIDRLHVHIGSGADPAIWDTAIRQALAIAATLPDVTSLDIGGGYKVHRYGDEPEADMAAIAGVFATALNEFALQTGRQLQLEIEPGTWLVANAGTLIAQIVDMVSTGEKGHIFLRLNTGMNDIIRPTMYGAQHRIEVLNQATEKVDYVVVGHNCETGDILTPAASDPEQLSPRSLNKAAIGDLIAIYDAGAYCASMAVRGYNAFPNAAEALV